MLQNYNFENSRPYLLNVKWLSAQIQSAKLGWQLSVTEGLIKTHLHKKIVAQTGSAWLATSHCNDLFNQSLIKRCELIAYGNA